VPLLHSPPAIVEHAARDRSSLLILAVAGSAALVFAARWLWIDASPTWLTIISETLIVGRVEAAATVFLGIFIEAVPFLLLGVLVSACLQALVPDQILLGLLPRHPIPAALVGGLLGALVPVCECGIVAVSRRLLRKGAPLPLAVALMLAGPVVNPIVLASTWVAFGGNLPFVAGRLGLVWAVAVVVALVLSRHPRPSDLLASALAASLSSGGDDVGARPSVGVVVRGAADEFVEMARYLVIGAAFASLLQTFVSRSIVLAIAHDPVLSVLALMLLAVLLSVCSTVDAFVALSFAGSFHAGALLGFLAFGPMVDLKSILMYGTVLRRPVVLLLVVLCGQIVFLVAGCIGLRIG
jgi:uncharacterized membrane protein YraQ (UPF0718 family)